MMAASQVHNRSKLQDLKDYQHYKHETGCVNCQNLKDELNEVRTELKSIKATVDLLNQDLASFSTHEHNQKGEDSPWITEKQRKNQHPRCSSKESFSEAISGSTACEFFAPINNRYQVLDNFQYSDSIMADRNRFQKKGKDHRNMIQTRSNQTQKEINNISSGNTDFDKTNSINYRPIQTIVNGLTPMELTSPKKRQKIETTSKKDHKIVIIGDSHTRLWAQNVKSPIKGNFQVQGLIKPGAGVETSDFSE